MPGMKECRTCSEIKELDCFYFRKDSGKHRGECKACTVVVSMRRHVANKGDPAIEAQKREYRKSYYKKHKDGKIRAWREENREVIRHKANEYYKTPAGKLRKIRARAKKKNLDFNLTMEFYESLWGKPCHYCGISMEVTGLDRKDNDKGYLQNNVVPCCYDCNTKKKFKPYESFLGESSKKDN